MTTETQVPTPYAFGARRIRFPTADQLDTGGGGNAHVSLYLVPAGDTAEIPEVRAERDCWTNDTTIEGPGWWLGGYGTNVVGEDVLARLVAVADGLLDLADSYDGDKWDDRWDLDRDQGDWSDEDELDVDLGLAEVARYRRASDWLYCLLAAESFWAPDWADLCRFADVDPLSPEALGIVVVALKARAAHDGQRVIGMYGYIAELRKEWLERAVPKAALDDADGRLAWYSGGEALVGYYLNTRNIGLRRPAGVVYLERECGVPTTLRLYKRGLSRYQRLPVGCDEPLAFALATRAAVEALEALAVLDAGDDD